MTVALCMVGTFLGTMGTAGPILTQTLKWYLYAAQTGELHPSFLESDWVLPDLTSGALGQIFNY